MRFFCKTVLAMAVLCCIQATFPGPQTSDYAIHGIDVSHHQNYINWDLVKNENIFFVFMKATEGRSFKDKRFNQNWAGAKRAGLRRGAYHFFSFHRTGKEQVNNYIESVSLSPNDLPPVIDLEYGSYSEKNRPKASVVVKELRYMLEKFHQHYGKRPILYCTYNCYNLYVKGIFDEYFVWIRDTKNSKPQLPNKQWLFWQYSAKGRISGIQGNVDMNVFYGSPKTFYNFYNP
ncbi:MAG: hypothetical protein GY810_19535 [Aureispira sp.]|nr:hypothetical protein [Aureispira sp.]